MPVITQTFNSRSVRGQATVEFIIIFLVMFMLVFGIFQFTLIYRAKTTLNYAVFEAVRAGTLNNARRDAVNEAFARGMAPLYTHEDNVTAVKRAQKQVLNEIAIGDQVCMDRVNPVQKDFTDHAIDNKYFPDLNRLQECNANGLDCVNTTRAIPVDNLFYRSDKGTSASPLTRGRVSIQDATLLKINVTYCYPLYVPFLNKVIPEWFTGSADGDERQFTGGIDKTNRLADLSAFKQACVLRRQLPITASAVMRMQSPVVEDPGFSTDPHHCEK